MKYILVSDSGGSPWSFIDLSTEHDSDAVTLHSDGLFCIWDSRHMVWVPTGRAHCDITSTLDAVLVHEGQDQIEVAFEHVSVGLGHINTSLFPYTAYVHHRLFDALLVSSAPIHTPKGGTHTLHTRHLNDLYNRLRDLGLTGV